MSVIVCIMRMWICVYVLGWLGMKYVWCVLYWLNIMFSVIVIVSCVICVGILVVLFVFLFFWFIVFCGNSVFVEMFF